MNSELVLGINANFLSSVCVKCKADEPGHFQLPASFAVRRVKT